VREREWGNERQRSVARAKSNEAYNETPAAQGPPSVRALSLSLRSRDLGLDDDHVAGGVGAGLVALPREVKRQVKERVQDLHLALCRDMRRVKMVWRGVRGLADGVRLFFKKKKLNLESITPPPPPPPPPPCAVEQSGRGGLTSHLVFFGVFEGRLQRRQLLRIRRPARRSTAP
jgi:hypothetical protein